MKRTMVGLLTAAMVAAPAALEASAPPVSLRGSPAAMVQQNRVAKEHGLSFYRTTAEIRAAVERGDLVKLEGNEDYAVADFVRLPYLHPAAALFVERLGRQYREACGQRLVVTSAVRPTNGQPSNAHALSVHPAGMAVDLRVSDRASCRQWLENSMLGMERRGLINGIREFRPPHYHVAVFPGPYMEFAQERMRAEEAEEAERLAAVTMDEVAPPAPAEPVASAFLPTTAQEAPTGPGTAGRAAIALILALPFGLVSLLRRRGRS